MATKAKAAGLEIIDPTTIEDLGGNRQRARKLANSRTSSFRNTTHGDGWAFPRYSPLASRKDAPDQCLRKSRSGHDGCGLRDTAIVRSRDRMTFHAAFGTREQSLDELTGNVMAVWNRVVGKLERGSMNIRSYTSRPRWVLCKGGGCYVMIPKIAPWKKTRVNELEELLNSEGVIGIVDVAGVPAKICSICEHHSEPSYR